MQNTQRATLGTISFGLAVGIVGAVATIILGVSAAFLDWGVLAGVRCLGITAGASAPEVLVEEVIAACHERYDVTIEQVTVTSEDVQFKLPRILAPRAATA